MTAAGTYSDYKAITVLGPDGDRRIRLIPPPDPSFLEPVRKAGLLPRGEERTAALAEAVEAAHRAGHAVSDITEAAGVSRETIYAIIRPSSDANK